MLNDDLPGDDDRRQDPSIEEIEQLDPPPERSLADDVNALIDDGKTYVEAELAYQKTRFSFAVGNGKSGIGFVFAALAFLHLALIGLVVGGIIVLAPVIGPLWAMLAVVGALLLGTAVFGLMAKKRFSKAARAFKDDDA
ncbi:phage holin family protein [Pontixanthobacter aestiaquae]|uniref:Phage holin family protein n=1 Tax=Pontixanthobacter aestiaquae TaxID=1509367 RepID=A0A844Z863_9SPHN|nr:phage holin family protein [Pontixanthobacter aestiaquae]MDN3645490.1 phage holin family protein [Pontixanthobacter aestiaquae]MXO83512.1 phage holin family protein [Pontixanthobacter aestiaquae]